jgi:hypothetical protein
MEVCDVCQKTFLAIHFHFFLGGSPGFDLQCGNEAKDRLLSHESSFLSAIN